MRPTANKLFWAIFLFVSVFIFYNFTTKTHHSIKTLSTNIEVLVVAGLLVTLIIYGVNSGIALYIPKHVLDMNIFGINLFNNFIVIILLNSTITWLYTVICYRKSSDFVKKMQQESSF